jgi:crotonobetainyl-CoA:carnitine CoA-transferase CaiB-like acyl-CoA transferase
MDSPAAAAAAGSPAPGPGPLAGVRVLDVTQVMAGPFCAMLLADLGADVIKVEPPDGDHVREQPDKIEGESYSFLAVNRNKRGIVLDLKQAAGRQAFLRLAAGADVIVENNRPGVMGHLGLGYEQVRAIKPDIIYASISGFGQTGPYAPRGGYDLIAQGMSGLMSITGEEGQAPVKCGPPVTDLGAGLFCCTAILAALLHRGRTGQGQRIDTSLLEAGIALSVWESVEYFSGRGVPKPMGSAHRMNGPYQAIRCADGYITVGANNQRLWTTFAEAIGRPELLTMEAFKDQRGRVDNRRQLAALIEEVTTGKPRAHWLERFTAAGIPCGPVYDYAEVFSDPHVLARGMVQEVAYPGGARARVIGPPVKMSLTPPTVRRRAPRQGEDSEAVLAEAGYSPAEIAAMRAAGVLGPG